MGLTHLHHITKIVDLPAFVKEGCVPTHDEVEKLPYTSFADQTSRQFPVHTKAACYLSYAYFLQQKDKFVKKAASRIERKFCDMADFWNMADAMDKLAEDLGPKHEKQAAIAEDYALTVSHESKPLHYFPINNRQAIEKSAEELLANRDKFPYALRKTAADNIVKAFIKAGYHISAVPEAIQSVAGLGICTKEAVVHEVTRRINFAKTTNEKKGAAPLTILVHQLNKCADDQTLSSDTLVKIAETLDTYDRHSGINKHYSREFDYPEDVLFSFTKQAADKIKNELVTMQNGAAYWLSDMTKASEAFDAIGDLKDDMVDLAGNLDMHKVADIVPTLPRDDADILSTALKAEGIPEANTTKEAMIKLATCGSHAAVDPKGVDRVSKKTVSMHKYLGTKENKKEKRAAAAKLESSGKVLDFLKEAAATSPTPREGDGKYMKKAPNKAKVNVLAKEEKKDIK